MPNPKQHEDRVQLARDVNDVFVLGIKSIYEFPEDYQQTLMDAYRFSAVRYDSGDEVYVPFSPETLDIL